MRLVYKLWWYAEKEIKTLQTEEIGRGVKTTDIGNVNRYRLAGSDQAGLPGWQGLGPGWLT